MDRRGPVLAVRGSAGISMVQGPKEFKQEDFAGDDSKTCRVMAFSPSGDCFAWSNGQCVRLVKYSSGKWTPSVEIAHPRASCIAFSPKGNVIATWEQYAVRVGEAAPNLHLWDVKTGTLLKSLFQKKQQGWCPQWTLDEELASRNVNNEVQFFQKNDFAKPATKLPIPKVESFSLSPRGSKYNVVCFIPGKTGSPSFAKLFTYPNFGENQVVASKSFFQADRMDSYWNSDGRHVLLLTQSEVDKTGGSYYGKQQLHFMSASGDTAMVQLGKDGPIYEITWNPANPNEFCAVYGYMPAKATIYNQKCEKIFDFGTGPRNTALYNAQGSLLLLGGFGNLRGAIEIWDIKQKKTVSKFEATDSTDIRWSPDGQHIMTSTCAPRLRMGNGFKVWHYTSSLLFERSVDPPHELWEVSWQSTDRTYPNFPISYKPVEGIKSAQPQASKEVYRPPGARGKASLFKLHGDEPAENQKKGDEPLSKSAAKNKKRRENAKKKREEEEDAAESKPAAQASQGSPASPESTGDPEKDKKIRKLNDKLVQIQKLKQQQKEGKTLEINQLEKIKKESEIVGEIEKLRL